LASFRQANELMMTICICCLSCLTWKGTETCLIENYHLRFRSWTIFSHSFDFIHNSISFSVKKEDSCEWDVHHKIPHSILMLAVITRNYIINKIYFSPSLYSEGIKTRFFRGRKGNLLPTMY
jgi:hypothetical protein